MSWRLPAEWEPQASVWLVWPRDETTWPGGRIDGARAAIRAAAQALGPQRVDLLVHPDLEAGPMPANVVVHRIPYMDSWIRDYGPLTLVDDTGRRRSLAFRFDAWGGKYTELAKDDAVSGRLRDAGVWPLDMEDVDLVLEGGALDTDGQGTFLCTESFAAGRGYDLADVEGILAEHLGCRKVIWLEGGIQGDDTDGHVDTIARFTEPRVVICSVAPDMEHPDHRTLLVNRERLHAATDALGRPLAVQDLPVPEPLQTNDGSPLPAGHANFLIGNKAVLVPTYGGISDSWAIQTLEARFPSRRVVGLDHTDLIWGMGGIHCLSMQVPAIG